MRALLTLLITTLSLSVFASPGDLDLSFNNPDGFVTSTGSNDLGAAAYAIIQQTDGKLVSAGYATPDSLTVHVELTRYNFDGTLDTSFNGTGKVMTVIDDMSLANAAIQQVDGKLVIAGYSEVNSGWIFSFILVRYNIDGSLDTSFGNDGIVKTAGDAGQNIAFALIQQDDGKLVTAGYFQTGTPNWNSDITLIRYNQDGSIDTEFGTNGIVRTDIAASDEEAYGLMQQADGKLVAVGRTYLPALVEDNFAVIRYNKNGTLDKTFNSTGIVVTNISNAAYPYDDAYSVAQQVDGKIVVSGYVGDNAGQGDFSLVRYNKNGSIDTSFGTNGFATSNIGNLCPQSTAFSASQLNGKFVIAGNTCDSLTPYTPTVLTRFNKDGSLDTSFGSSGISTLSFQNKSYSGLGLTQQMDGNLILAGADNTLNPVEHAFVARIVNDDSEVIGDDNNDELGTSVTTADVDGDGIDDVIVGAPFANIAVNTSTIKGAGSIKIISGKDHSLIRLIKGTATNQQLGSSVVSVPDQDNDGVPDLLVGEPKLNRVSLYSGSTGLRIKTLIQSSRIKEFGAALAYGDVNNDGTADVIVGAPGSNKVFVYDGHTVFNTVNPVPLYTRTGGAGSFGASIAVDNQHRLLVGSPNRNRNTGAVEVFDGSNSSSSALFTLQGENKNDKFGSSISALTSDGNWLIGAPNFSTSEIINNKKVVHKSIGRVQLFSSVDASLLHSIVGNADNDNFGSSVNANSDIDQDGTSDLVVGAAKSDVSKPVNGQYTLMKASGRVNVMSGASVVGP